MLNISKDEAEGALKELMVAKIRERIGRYDSVDCRMLSEFLYEELYSKIKITDLPKK